MIETMRLNHLKTKRLDSNIIYDKLSDLCTERNENIRYYTVTLLDSHILFLDYFHVRGKMKYMDLTLFLNGRK